MKIELKTQISKVKIREKFKSNKGLVFGLMFKVEGLMLWFKLTYLNKRDGLDRLNKQKLIGAIL